MKTLGPDGRIEGAQVAPRTAVRATPALPERPIEPPGEVTTIWRDGEVVRETPGQRARVRPCADPIPEREAVR